MSDSTENSNEGSGGGAIGVHVTPVASGVTDTSGVDTTAFELNAGPTDLIDSIKAYWAKLRAGELGALPAVSGFVALCIYFSTRNEFFFTPRNFANLLTQASATVVIAMGLVFVLLLGEIDLSAGTTAGVSAAILAIQLKNGHELPYSVAIALGSGVIIGLLIGFLVSKIRIPSFVVTLALFLALQGVVLKVIGEGGNVPVRNERILDIANNNLTPAHGWIFLAISVVGFALLTLWRWYSRMTKKLTHEPIATVIVKIAVLASIGAFVISVFNINRNSRGPGISFIKPYDGWIVLGIVMGVLALLAVLYKVIQLKRQKSADSWLSLAIKLVLIAFVGAFLVLTYNVHYNADRLPPPGTLKPIKGVPLVVPIIFVLLLILTFILSRTSYGRHLYAVGGNAEAARRAGIKVKTLRLSAFLMCSFLAAIGGIVLASRLGAVNPQVGGGNELLFAVGAAVIGGTSLFGGRGKVRDAVIGGLVIAVINNGLGLLKYDSGGKYLWTGAVLLVAASVDAISRRGAAQARV